MLDQSLFPIETPAVAGQIAILAHNAMARHYHGHGVRCTGASDGANRLGSSNSTSYLAVSARCAVWNPAQLFPNAPLERGRLHIGRQVELRFPAAQMCEDFPHPS